MKILSLISLLMVSSAFAGVDHLDCKVKLMPTGVYYNSCPRDSLAEAVDVRLGSGPYPMSIVWVRCVKPEVVCKKVEKQ